MPERGVGSRVEDDISKAKQRVRVLREEQAHANELTPFSQPIKTQPGEHTRNADQKKNRKLNQQRIVQHLRTYIAPHHQKEHEKPEQRLPRGNVEKVQAAP